MRASIYATSVLLAASAAGLYAQSFTVSPCQNDGNSYSGGEHVCEVRSATLPLNNGHLAVSGKNGSIDVVGEDRRDILLEAQVEAHGSSRREAQAIEHQVEIITNGEIRAQGPEPSGLLHRNTWSVNYRLRVPRHLAAHLHTENGSVKLVSLDGEITAESTNGSITLSALAGDINAHTVNGSLKVSLEGSQWKGSGLSAHTTNGSVSVAAPADYSARLVADTTNGRIHLDLPHASQSTDRRHVDTNIGQGGSTLRFETTNGSVHLDRN